MKYTRFPYQKVFKSQSYLFAHASRGTGSAARAQEARANTTTHKKPLNMSKISY